MFENGKHYEVYINGAFAKRHATLNRAEETLARFPDAKGQIFKIVPTVDIALIKEHIPGNPVSGSR